ncbi:mechanosensitive ion channel [Novosphingobium umbonatum]|uniref:Mechanosensitive ion channel n=1 Tax=Novosphingobium umbonatum TaxID=1908524 RepID=A0A3S2VR01_9SPHN|nr:mechanosensitive ion channel domain-containing protein [Novosphingobium umbonatum]RVU03430.1 mechanosensitive ion channel [Novosphingobium umbonatum]
MISLDAARLGSKMLRNFQNETLDGDALPSFDEVMHWSGRVSHAAMAAGIGIGVALLIHGVAFALLKRVGRRNHNQAESVAAPQLYHSARWAMVAAGVAVADSTDRLLAKLWGGVQGFIVPALTGWVIYALVKTGAELLSRRAETSGDEMTARSRRTRITVLSRSIGFVIVFITLALMLLGIPAVRHVGATLIASAGLMGLAVGAAAQPALKSLIAGLQIALTEPIRMGDVVVVDGEQGRVEDIRLSYVVIRTADERRLIVPTVKFLDSTFQNWTRVGGIAGPVVVPIRPGFAIAPLREAFHAALAASAHWDGRVGELVMSEARVGSVELKMTVSAADPSVLGTLRAEIREAMLEWLRVNQPDALCMEP